MSPDPSTSPDIPDALREVVGAARDRKAIDLRVILVDEVSDFTEYFLICSGSSDRQVQAIADAVQRKLRDAGIRPQGVEGYRNGKWVLLDFGDFVVHVFDDETRRFYGLERLWADGADVTDSFAP